jgi:hypothetical protein
MFHNGQGGQFRCKFRGYFELFFIMTYLDNLYTNKGGYFELCFAMVDVGNLCKGGLLYVFFIMAMVGTFFNKL